MDSAQHSELRRWENGVSELAWISVVDDDESVRAAINDPTAHSELHRWENGLSELPWISVVDDDESVRQAINDLMDSMGLRTEVFGSAEEFLKSDGLHQTSCLIVDVRMPGMTGLELQSHLNAAGFRIPTVFISAHDDGEAKSRALAAGAVDFLKKPFSEDALLRALRACAEVEGDVTNDIGQNESF
jgi:FixJ family two-component response regulator